MIVQDTISDAMLNSRQLEAIDNVKAWVQRRDSRIYRIGGRAGTGKTSIIKRVLEHLVPGPVAVTAYTGKACSVLKNKGINIAQTLHSLLYNLDNEASQTSGRLSFRKVERLNCEFVVIDEGSLPGLQIMKDLWSFPNVRILVFGDHWQLEPVEGDLNLMENPDFTLETIHRQAQNSNILAFAERCYRGIEKFKPLNLPDLRIRPAYEFWSIIKDVDQCIVGFNKTRHKVNSLFRERLGHLTPYPCVGERIIFLRNKREYGVYNGLVGFVTKIRNVTDEVVLLDLEDEVGNRLYELPTHRHQYGMDSLASMVRTELILADYGYSMTGHKSMGSEWQKGAVLEEIAPGWNRNRWAYTVSTRFRELDYCR